MKISLLDYACFEQRLSSGHHVKHVKPVSLLVLLLLPQLYNSL